WLSARSAADAVERELGGHIGAMQLIAFPDVVDDQSRFARRAQNFRSAFGGELTLIDADTPALRAGRDAAPDVVQVAAESKRPAVAVVPGSPGSPSPVLAIAVPVGADGLANRVVRTTMPMEPVVAALRSVVIPSEWSLIVQDDRGAEVARIGARDLGDDVARVGARANLVQWTVLLERPSSEHRRAAWQASAWVALAALAAAALSLVIAVSGGRRLQSAIGALTAPAPVPEAAARIVEFTEVRKLLDERATSEQSMRGRAERAAVDLEVRDRQLRVIVESASDGIVTVDDSQTIVLANPAAARIFGYSVPDLIGRPLQMLIPERFRQQHSQQIDAFGTGGATARPMGSGLEVKGLRADGGEFAVEASISHATVDGRRLFTVMVRDVTEQRKAQAEATASRNMLRAALASMSDAVFVFDARGQIVELNDACVGFLHLTDKASCPRTLAEVDDLLHVRDAGGNLVPLDQRLVRRGLRGESGSAVEFHLERKATGQSWIGSHNFAPVRSADGQIVGVVVTVRDVTELKRMHDELATSHADLRRLVAMQDRVQEAERKRIARELHDDLQQTLAAILIEGGAARQALQADPEAARAPLQRIDELASAAVASTRRIVADLRPQMLEELGLVPALQALARRFEEHSGIDCRFDGVTAAGAGVAAPSVGTCLYRVAQEGLNNVSKHAHASRAWIELADAGPGHLRLRVGDDGQGMRPSARRKPQALGLVGMSERVRALGGTIRIDTALGAGTVVEVEVPLSGEANVKAAARARP
ncbi:MAG TPA: PAS domain S-box protein, partial [Burkholderiaceae bacterium]|nr:PAS domain S-box protein [Burkholderiaceae bacterium]